jgi:sensor histidine kinase YesM
MTSVVSNGVVRQIALWVAVSSLAGLGIGLAVGLFQSEGVETPILVISVLFGNVVGLTAMVGAVWLFPRLGGHSGLLRFPLFALALLSGAALGSVAVLSVYPLFVLRELRLAVVIVAVNGILALVVGGIVLGYEQMRGRLQDTLREMEEVRLVEARLREEAARAELTALQARINPHFFFNTLNTITSLLDEDVEKAEDLLETLADLFRYAFRVADAVPVPLAEEIAFSRGYLRIEQARFGDRLCVAWNVDPTSLAVRVPGLTLQPLLENAVGHGIAPRARGGRIEITTAVEGATLRVEVTDDGVGLSDLGERLIHDEHGLGNVARRLATFYGRDADLVLSPAPGGVGALARLTLPTTPVAAGRGEHTP